MLGTAFVLLPDTLMPDHIARRQRGAWGEQNTAKVLKALTKEGWLVCHDLATTSGRGNWDHIVAGPAVYLLDSKLLRETTSGSKATSSGSGGSTTRAIRTPCMT